MDKELSEFHKNSKGKNGLHPRCKICAGEITRAWTSANRARSNGIKDKYRFANASKITAQIKRWEKNNPGKKAAQVRKYQAFKLSATPKWLTVEQLKDIQNMYVEASRLTKETGIPHEVDHIIPLQGKNVRGLHVSWNLRIVTRLENRRFGNKLIIK